MSRCFPYRPTLCVRNGASGEALIETIKPHCEKVKSKTESLKEKKRERKEKRKEGKEKKVKPCGFTVGKVKKLNNEKSCLEEKNRALLAEHLLKKNDEEAERLEKSSLTDEHNEPVCYLSDGTQSSNKRKREPTPSSAPSTTPSSAPSTTPSITVHKNILRIRLPSLKQRESDPSLSKGQLCPTVGGAIDSLVHQVPYKEQCQVTNKVEEACQISNSLRKDGIAQFDAGNRTTSNEKNVPGTGSFYKALIEDWVPPPFQSALNDSSDDEDWLFGTKRQSQELKRLKPGNDVLPCHRSSSLWPRAHYLPEADIYALPYSIPF